MTNAASSRPSEDDPTAWINYPAYQRDTRRLSLEQRGMLLMLMIKQAQLVGPLSDDPEAMRRIVRCDRKDWARHWPVLRRFCKPGGMPWLRVSEEMPEDTTP